MPAFQRQGQSFLGIESGLTGQTVIMLFAWRSVGNRRSALHLRLRDDLLPEPDVLGYTEFSEAFRYKVWLRTQDGRLEALDDAISTTDAAMDILQLLSDVRDPRMHLEKYPMPPTGARRHGWGKGYGPTVDKWTGVSAWV